MLLGSPHTMVFCLPSTLDLPKGHDAVLDYDSTAADEAFDRERYLELLPEPDASLLEEMSRRYPAPFDTLPVQVRSPHCWRLFVKFCFFSGLPIAEGEMHYRARRSAKTTAFPPDEGEEIALSHEVMEGEFGFFRVALSRCMLGVLLCVVGSFNLCLLMSFSLAQ